MLERVQRDLLLWPTYGSGPSQSGRAGYDARMPFLQAARQQLLPSWAYTIPSALHSTLPHIVVMCASTLVSDSGLSHCLTSGGLLAGLW
jgi:hypothetical protein